MTTENSQEKPRQQDKAGTKAPKNESEGAPKEMSEEDKQLVDTLNMIIERLEEKPENAALQASALEALKTQIKSSAVTMTSIPKALKYLLHEFDRLASIYQTLVDAVNKKVLADIISIIAMTRHNATGGAARECLQYRLLGGEEFALADWGHEYVRHLALEIIEEWAAKDMSKAVAHTAEKEQICKLSQEIAKFLLDHNAEPDACDLLYEIGQLDRLVAFLEEDKERDHQRVCLYLLSCIPFAADSEDFGSLEVAHRIYLQKKDFPRALIVAIRMNDTSLIKKDFEAASEEGQAMQRQLAYILARQRISLDTQNSADNDQLQSILNNTFLTDHFRAMAKELEILEPKVPEDIYKSHLVESGKSAASAATALNAASLLPSARQNLAGSFVNAFVNAGYGTDKLLSPKSSSSSGRGDDGDQRQGEDSVAEDEDESKSWIYKCKDHGITSTVASIGMLNVWNADDGLAKLDRYLYSENEKIRAGAILGIGLVHAGTKNEADPALALLREYLEGGEEAQGGDSKKMEDGPPSEGGAASPTGLVKICALIGLALAYGGSQREDIVEVLAPYISSSNEDVKTASMASLALGHIFVGSCDGEMASMILQSMMERPEADLDNPMARFLALSLALLFLGKTEAEAEVILETLSVIEHPIGQEAATLVKICSYAGTGNVLKIQELLLICTKAAVDASAAEEQAGNGKDAKKSDPSESAPSEQQGGVGGGSIEMFSVIGISLICMMEDVGKEMSQRLFSHLMHFGSPSVKAAVPLALGLLYCSHSSASSILDLLSKYSHDHDKSVAINAIFAMGLLASGSNNAKTAQMLRQLAAYYQRDADCLYMVRIAQGLVHAGKGTVTFSPIHCHRQLFNPAAMAGLLTTIVAMTDAQSLLIEDHSYLLYFLAAAIHPRFVMTLSPDLESQSVLMRVGQAVDVVGQAGKPKTITGFQTHSTPVLLSYSERAELATEQWVPLTPILENFVILKPNPLWIEEDTK